MGFEFAPKFTFPTAIVNKHNFVSQNEIFQLASSLKDINYQEATLFETKSKTDEIRKSRIKWIPHNDKFLDIYNKILIEIHRANSKYYRFNLKNLTEPIQYTEYHGGDKGHYDWHIDIGNESSSHRKISITLQLSSPEEYEGGELEFKIDGNVQTTPKELGLITIFPSYFLHRVKPVTKGIRRSLVLWVGGCSFK